MPHTILVLEDDAPLRESIVEVLQEHGYRVLEAGCTQDALALASRNALELVIADVRMEGPDGLACLEGIRTCNRFLVVTGYADSQAPRRALKLGVSDYLYKPFTLKALLLSVERALRAEQEGAEYRGILASLVGGARRLLQRAATAMVGAELATLEGVRERAFQAMYVAIRSGVLGSREGHVIWHRLEELELERERRKEGGPSRDGRALGEDYRYLVDLLCSPSGPSTGCLTGPQPAPGCITWSEFSVLHRQVKSAAVSSEQLKLAPFLRTLDLTVRQQSPELMQMYQALWTGG